MLGKKNSIASAGLRAVVNLKELIYSNNYLLIYPIYSTIGIANPLLT